MEEKYKSKFIFDQFISKGASVKPVKAIDLNEGDKIYFLGNFKKVAHVEYVMRRPRGAGVTGEEGVISKIRITFDRIDSEYHFLYDPNQMLLKSTLVGSE